MFVKREEGRKKDRKCESHPYPLWFVHFLPPLDSCSGELAFSQSGRSVSAADIEKSTSSPHTKADALPRSLSSTLYFTPSASLGGTRECGCRTREYRLRGPSSPRAGLLPIVALIVTFNEHGSRCISRVLAFYTAGSTVVT